MTWWHPLGGLDPDYDVDGDLIPDYIEYDNNPALAGGPYHWLKVDTYDGVAPYPNDNFSPPYADFERNCCLSQGTWTIGSANGEDWARPGKQWP